MDQFIEENLLQCPNPYPLGKTEPMLQPRPRGFLPFWYRSPGDEVANAE